MLTIREVNVVDHFQVYWTTNICNGFTSQQQQIMKNNNDRPQSSSQDRFKNKYRICNPTTKRVLELPDPHEGSHGIVFSYVPSTSNYKFVSIYDDESSTECCEVFSVENDESSWRLLGMPTRDYPNRNRKKCSVVSTGDAVHCVGVIAIGAVMVEEVVSLDLGTEQFYCHRFSKRSIPKLGEGLAFKFHGDVVVLGERQEHVPLQQSLVHLKGMQPEDKKSTQPPPLKDMQPEDN
ncbi:hypothetical protein POM88_050847 [Heracleum sosnowskyi]|uniref:F-box associated beta-propeller type 3 domain-containing protein n=1 Tax=Heracleum sosnowskyi TaxID=360622 RepID=A0AAD8GZH4_9APIA|nr:hypothetical protein POM88_050847 [Heracleum sosnowskyi]